MSDKPRVLTLWLTSWYASGHGKSGEEMLWGDGMLGRLGYDQHHVRLEDAGHADLERIIRGYAPYEFVVYAPYQEVPHWLRGMLDPGTPIVSLHSDATWRFDTFDRHFVNVSDYMWVTDEAAADKLHAMGYEGGILSNWACRPEWALADPIRVPQRGASFAGWCYGDRMATLRAIGEAGPITVLVHDSHERLLSQEDYFRFMASWAFALCLTKSSHGERQFKGRMFEPAIFGTVLVTEPMAGLEQWWTPDVECVVFNSPAEAQEKMAWLLADPARYLAMSEAAYKRALAEHNWYMRFREIIRRLGKEPPAWPTRLLTSQPQPAARRPALTIPMSAIDAAPPENGAH